MSFSIAQGTKAKSVLFWLQTSIYATVFWYASSIPGMPQKLIGTLLFCAGLILSAKKLSGSAFRRAASISTVLSVVCIALYEVSDWFILLALPLLSVGLAYRCVYARANLPGKRYILPLVAVIILGNVASALLEQFPAWIPALLLILAVPMPIPHDKAATDEPVSINAKQIAVLVLFFIHSQFIGVFIRDILMQDAFTGLLPMAINIASILGYLVFAFVFFFARLRLSVFILMLSFVVGYTIYLIPLGGMEPAFVVCSLFAAGGNNILGLVLPVLLWEKSRSPLIAVLGLVIVQAGYAVTLGIELLVPAGWSLTMAGRLGASVAVVLCFAILFVVRMKPEAGAAGSDASVNENKLPLPDDLTNRETEVALLLLEEYNRKEIAGLLSISPSTLNKHCNAVYRKTQCDGQSELIRRYSAQMENGVAPLFKKIKKKLPHFNSIIDPHQ